MVDMLAFALYYNELFRIILMTITKVGLGMQDQIQTILAQEETKRARILVMNSQLHCLNLYSLGLFLLMSLSLVLHSLSQL